MLNTTRLRLYKLLRQFFIVMAIGCLVWTVVRSSHQPLTAIGVQRWEQSAINKERENQQKEQKDAKEKEAESLALEQPMGVFEYFAEGLWMVIKYSPIWMWVLVMINSLICSPFIILLSLFNRIEGFNYAWIFWSLLVILACCLHEFYFIGRFWLVALHLLALPSIVTFVYIKVQVEKENSMF